MSVELMQDHVNMNVLDETKASLQWVYESIIAERNQEIPTLKQLDTEAKKEEVIAKAYAIIEAHSTKTDAELLQACNGGASCLLFALQIILVEAKVLSGKKCIDGIYGDKTKQAIIAYKTNIGGYTRATGGINTKLLQVMIQKKGKKVTTPPPGVTPPVKPNPVVKPSPVPPKQPTPKVPEQLPPVGEYEKFLQQLPEHQRGHVKLFLEKTITEHKNSCDKKVNVLFDIGTSAIGNPYIRLQTAPGTYVTLDYPGGILAISKKIPEVNALFNRLCAYLNTEKKGLFYK